MSRTFALIGVPSSASAHWPGHCERAGLSGRLTIGSSGLSCAVDCNLEKYVTDVTNATIINAYADFPHHLIGGFGDEGDLTRQYILNPTLFALLGNVRDTAILDAGCGQGYLARLLARQGAHVIGIEPSDAFYRYAFRREQTEQLGIHYLQDDLYTLESNSKHI